MKHFSFLIIFLFLSSLTLLPGCNDDDDKSPKTNNQEQNEKDCIEE